MVKRGIESNRIDQYNRLISDKELNDKNAIDRSDGRVWIDRKWVESKRRERSGQYVRKERELNYKA